MKKLEKQKIQYVRTSSLKPMDRPLKKHDDVERLIESFNQFGWTVPILVQKGTRRIVAGHGRWLAAKREGMKEVPVIFKDFSEQQADAYAIVDNQLTEVSPWDPVNLEHHALSLEKEGYDLSWTGLEITRTPKGKPVKEDEAPEKLADPPKSKLGQIYALGAHRLMCGDATNKEDVARLLRGARVNMIFTDPPYNVDYGSSKKTRHKIRSIENDKMETSAWVAFNRAWLEAMMEFYEGGDMYCFGASGPEGMRQRLLFVETGFHWSATIIWKKDQLILCPANYQRIYEPCFYGWFKKSTFNNMALRGKQKENKPAPDRKETEVWEVARPKRSDEHPTMKPVEIAARAIRNSSLEGDVVYDGFVGSGTTIVAAEQMERAARAIEVDPAYVDVVRRRYWAFGERRRREGLAGRHAGHDGAGMKMKFKPIPVSQRDKEFRELENRVREELFAFCGIWPMAYVKALLESADERARAARRPKSSAHVRLCGLIGKE